MRKRCHRRHHNPGDHPAMAPAGLVGDHAGLALSEHLAFDALAAGTAQAADVAVLVLTAKVARVLAAEGIGGVDPTQGFGLHGLSDRIAALDGSIVVRSPAGEGTVVEVEIPCG